MTRDKAYRLFHEQRGMDEGWLDTAARLEAKRGLTAEEKEALDILTAGWVEAMKRFQPVS